MMKSMTGRYDDVTHVWLDLDDTLIDFRGNSRLALAEVYEHERFDRLYRTVDEWIENYEFHNRRLWELYNRAEISGDFLRMERFRAPLSDAGVDPERATEMSRRLDPLYLDCLAATPGTVDGARELLEFLKGRGYTVGVLSNGFADVQQRKLETAGLRRLVDIVVLSDDIGVNKPDKRLFDHAMVRVGETDPRRHLMIGDNASTDIAGAVNAGWQAIHFDPAGRHEGVFRHRVMRVERLTQIIGLMSNDVQ